MVALLSFQKVKLHSRQQFLAKASSLANASSFGSLNRLPTRLLKPQLMMVNLFHVALLFMSLLHLDFHHCEPAIKVAIVGSGNWGTSAARRIARNLKEFNEMEDEEKYDTTVSMWVYEEIVRHTLCHSLNDSIYLNLIIHSLNQSINRSINQ